MALGCSLEKQAIKQCGKEEGLVIPTKECVEWQMVKIQHKIKGHWTQISDLYIHMKENYIKIRQFYKIPQVIFFLKMFL